MPGEIRVKPGGQQVRASSREPAFIAANRIKAGKPETITQRGPKTVSRPIGFGPKLTEKIIAAARERNIPVPRRRSLNQMDDLLAALISEIGSMAATARELKVGYSNIKKHVCRARGLDYESQTKRCPRNDSRKAGLPPSRIKIAKRCCRCGALLPKKPVVIDGQVLTRLCYRCWIDAGSDDVAYQAGGLFPASAQQWKGF